MLRRESILLPDGRVVEVPVISGNTFRGRLRRIGEELLRDVLAYEGKIPAAAAHALRGGGALTKTGREPLTGSRLAQLRSLIPQVGVFGAAGGGAIIDGALTVQKVIPHARETQHLTGVASERTVHELSQVEFYTRQDDTGTRDFSPGPGPADHRSLEDDLAETSTRSDPSQQMLFRLETFLAGTTFSTGAQLRRPTPVEVSFFRDVLDEFTTRGHLGGRIGLGHGRIRVDFTLHGDHEDPVVDWRPIVAERRDDAIAALQELA
jgi:hypothetical protein